MNLPNLLRPVARERFVFADGSHADIPKAVPVFVEWAGPVPSDTYGGKAILDSSGRPAFAELLILDLLKSVGWDGVWIDTYRNKFRRAYWDSQPLSELPVGPMGVLNRIVNRRGGARKGTWDVMCWSGDHFLFAESKRAGRDSIKSQQVAWLRAALDEGLTTGSFLIVEWSIQHA